MVTLYFNNTGALNELWYESHASVVKRVCMELGQSENMNDVVEKILGPKPKVKKIKDPNRPKKAKTAFMFYCDAHRPALMKIQKKNNYLLTILFNKLYPLSKFFVLLNINPYLLDSFSTSIYSFSKHFFIV